MFQINSKKPSTNKEFPFPCAIVLFKPQINFCTGNRFPNKGETGKTLDKFFESRTNRKHKEFPGNDFKKCLVTQKKSVGKVSHPKQNFPTEKQKKNNILFSF